MRVRMLFVRTTLLCLLLAGTAAAQTYEPEYFPESLMRKEEVKRVSTWETRVDDPLHVAGAGNRIRLSRNLVNETNFDRRGLPTRKVYYAAGGERIRDYLIYSYNDNGLLTTRSYYYPRQAWDTIAEEAPGFMLVRHHRNRYNGREKVVCRTISEARSGDETLTDSIRIEYDLSGRRSVEVHHPPDENGPQGLIRTWEYKGDVTTVTLKRAFEVLSREVITHDADGRVISVASYFGEEDQPRYVEQYSYDPRGWLSAVTYTYDWKHFKRPECVTTRQNKFDDHGKLVEAQLDYANGSRVMRYFDYSYYIAE